MIFRVRITFQFYEYHILLKDFLQMVQLLMSQSIVTLIVFVWRFPIDQNILFFFPV
jgi:hypothetical protein